MKGTEVSDQGIADDDLPDADVAFPHAVYTNCTDARKTSRKLPFVPLFGTSGVASRRDGSLRKTLQHHEIGHERCSAGPSQNRVVQVHRKCHINFR